jgi:hypothetical protein
MKILQSFLRLDFEEYFSTQLGLTLEKDTTTTKENQLQKSKKNCDGQRKAK